MSDNKFNFYATVITPKTTQIITILSIGDWRNQLSQGVFYPPGSLGKLEDALKAMVKRGKSPFNFSWSPYVDIAKKVNQATLFRTLSEKDRCTIELKIQLSDTTGIKQNTFNWNFYDVGVIRTRPTRKNEIVETHFSKFQP